MLYILSTVIGIAILVTLSAVYTRIWWYITGGILRFFRYLKKHFEVTGQE